MKSKTLAGSEGLAAAVVVVDVAAAVAARSMKCNRRPQSMTNA